MPRSSRWTRTSASPRPSPRAATIEGAWLTFQEREQASIEPGKRADFLVLSEDLLTVPEERLSGIVADLTVAGGRVVYERAGESAALPDPG